MIVEQKDISIVGACYLVTDYDPGPNVQELKIHEVSPSKTYVRYSLNRESVQPWISIEIILSKYTFIEKLR